MSTWAPYAIATNSLLHPPGPMMAADELRRMKLLLGDAPTPNFGRISLDVIRRVDEIFGSEGIFKLGLLAMTEHEGTFAHYHQVVEAELVVREQVGGRRRELPCDPAVEDPDLARLNSHVLMPSLSRKLYNPGTHHGYLTYGLGGPRILVSHPFRGAVPELYDVFPNSIDVVRSLMLLGFLGSFLLLDNLPGMNPELAGVPRWLLWFSMVAANSDLVVFVREEGAPFTAPQLAELGYVPRRVRRCTVELSPGELRSAKIYDPTDPAGSGGLDMITSLPDGRVGNRDDERAFEASFSAPFLDTYVEPDVPRDGLVVLQESGEIEMYPLDHPVYGAASPP